MRQAPPVSVNLSGGGGWRGAGVLLAAIAAATAVAWACAWLPVAPSVRIPATLAAAAVAALLAWHLDRPRQRRLQWDGTCWTVEDVPGDVRVMWNLGGWLLLRHRPAGAARACWLPVPAREAGPAWHGLRAALHAHPAAPPDPAVEG